MNLADGADLEDYVNRPERVSAADCSAIANEAGLRRRAREPPRRPAQRFGRGVQANVNAARRTSRSTQP